MAPSTRTGLRVVVLVDSFPVLSETFVVNEVRALRDAGVAARVEALTRPGRPDRLAAREIVASYLEEDTIAGQVRDLAWLMARHPLRCASDLRDRRRWARDEPVSPLRSLAGPARRIVRQGNRHIHAHFAAGAGLSALRLARLLDVPYSVTAHAYDIYLRPANLREKLESAAFATSGCDYTVRDLRAIVSSDAAPRIHKVIMGVDGSRFARRCVYPGGRRVLAVGRLVEKKGFAHLLDATALLRETDTADRVVIAGDGPLRAELEAQRDRLGLGDTVQLLGWCDPDAIRDQLELADVLAMPCVVAADGDRDSMPVVVKEALAMQVPVVASDEVGLPEIVMAPWGRLVAPGDATALAEALAEVLALDTAERERIGVLGREFVLRTCDVHSQTARLVDLISAADHRRAPWAGGGSRVG